MKLSSTQIGALAENLIANELMIESGGRLSPFQPVADDDGIDILIYDKITGNALPIQIKARTTTINKRGKQERGNTVHFEIRKATLRKERKALLLCILIDYTLRATERAWLLPLTDVPTIATDKGNKYAIRANKQLSSKDKYKSYQCLSIGELSRRLISLLENKKT